MIITIISFIFFLACIVTLAVMWCQPARWLRKAEKRRGRGR